MADLAWDLQDRLRGRASAAGRHLAEAVGWSLEQASYGLRKRLVWPTEDRAERLGRPARALATGAVVLLAAGAGVAGLIWAAPDKPDKGPVTTAATSASAPLAVAEDAPKRPAEPTLHGAAPVFKPAKSAPASEIDPAKAIVRSAPVGEDSSAAATTASASQPPSSTASASAAPARAAGAGGPPAGPRALAVADDFASAFVLYETGDSTSSVRSAFGETATPALARALLRRPPRLPANVKVPKAKVVNVVPAPSRGDIYPVSVSLLRVGLTSELRLEMEKRKADGWRVTNVLG